MHKDGLIFKTIWYTWHNICLIYLVRHIEPPQSPVAFNAFRKQVVTAWDAGLVPYMHQVSICATVSWKYSCTVKNRSALLQLCLLGTTKAPSFLSQCWLNFSKHHVVQRCTKIGQSFIQFVLPVTSPSPVRMAGHIDPLSPGHTNVLNISCDCLRCRPGAS